MKILLTGYTSGLGKAIHDKINCYGISRSNNFDNLLVKSWFEKFADYDIVINNAYPNQLEVLENFFSIWNNNPTKKIINIGSYVIDHERIEIKHDNNYWRYRLDKIALNEACKKMSNHKWCCQIINFGPLDTNLIKDKKCLKINISEAVDMVLMLINNNKMKRIDFF